MQEVNESMSNRGDQLQKDRADLQEKIGKLENAKTMQLNEIKLQEALVRAKSYQVDLQKIIYKSDNIDDAATELDNLLNKMYTQWKPMKVAKGAMSDKCGICLEAVKDVGDDAPEFKWVVFRCGHLACDNCIEQNKRRDCHVCREPLQDFDPLQRMGSNFRPAIDLFDEFQKSMDELRNIQQKIKRYTSFNLEST